MADELQITDLWKDYEAGRQYQSSIGLTKNIPLFVKFYEGEQWGKVTERTKGMPRPVTNIIKMICRAKQAAILSSPVKLVFKSYDDTKDTELLNRFAEYICKEIGQDKLDRQGIADAVKKGSYFYHYYWDAEAQGKNGIREGGVRCAIIDALHIYFANPLETDEQKQKWIIISSREDIDAVKAKADKDADIDAICGDYNDDSYNAPEQQGEKLVTLLTRYFRRDGEVYCEMATKTATVKKPFPIAPDVETVIREMDGEDAPNANTADDSDDEAMNAGARAYLYPIVAGQYEPREHSIYGLGEVEGLINNQKAINLNMAMSLYGIEMSSQGKYIVMPKALGGQKITNEPGQVIVDNTGTGNGIKKLTEQTQSNAPMTILETLTNMTRVVTGSTEVMTGEVLGANMSGSAIAQLQAQAQAPTEDLKKAFWEVKERQGKVLAQFFRLYYRGGERKTFGYYETERMQNANGIIEEREIPHTAVFDGAAYDGADYDVVVEATSGTKASSAGDIVLLENLVKLGQITPEQYVEAYPSDAISNKTEILKGIRNAKADQVIQLQQQMTAYEQKLAEAVNVIAQQNQIVNSIVPTINENKQLKALLAELYAEAKAKIDTANATINEVSSDATDMAKFIAGGSANGMPDMPNGGTGAGVGTQGNVQMQKPAMP